jgi:hypothetical protein
MTLDVDRERLTGWHLLVEDYLDSLPLGMYDVTNVPYICVSRDVARTPGTPEEQALLDFVREHPEAMCASHHETDTVYVVARRPPNVRDTHVVGRDVTVVDVSQVTHILFVMED